MGKLRLEFVLACGGSYGPERGVKRVEHHKLEKRAIHVGCILHLNKLRRELPLIEPNHINRGRTADDLGAGDL
jgi:hypothetical protein